MTTHPFARRSGVITCSSTTEPGLTGVAESRLSVDQIKRAQRIMYWADSSVPALHQVRETGRLDAATRAGIGAFQAWFNANRTRPGTTWPSPRNPLKVDRYLGPCTYAALEAVENGTAATPIPGATAAPGVATTRLTALSASAVTRSAPTTRVDPVTRETVTSVVETNPTTGGVSTVVTRVDPATQTTTTEIVHGEADGVTYEGAVDKQPSEPTSRVTLGTVLIVAGVLAAGALALAATRRTGTARRLPRLAGAAV